MVRPSAATRLLAAAASTLGPAPASPATPHHHSHSMLHITTSTNIMTFLNNTLDFSTAMYSFLTGTLFGAAQLRREYSVFARKNFGEERRSASVCVRTFGSERVDCEAPHN